MRDYGFELEPAVVSAVNQTEYEFHNGFLQNPESISMADAKQYDSLLLLRWRNRECIQCNQSFDITVEGLLYKCGVCAK